MTIYGKIDLTPKEVYLPYDVNKPVDTKIQFYATGGDGSFSWISGNPSILPIMQDGLAESQLKRLKDFHDASTDNVFETIVKAALSKNSKIFKSAKVFFLPPVKLEIVSYNFETSVNDFVDLHIGLFAFFKEKFLPFTSCENLNFETDFGNQQLFVIASPDSDHTEKLKNGCRILRLKGVHVGLTTLTISYRHGNKILSDSVQLMVNEKLIVFNPHSNIVVLPIGSSRNVIYQHGPKKVYTVGSDLMKSVKLSSDIAEITEIKSDFQDHRFGYNILCRELGETKLTLDIYNLLLNQDNFVKYTSTIETAIYCVKPRFINLHSLDKLKTSCPIDGKSSLLHVRSMQDTLDIEIEVLDQQKRKLDNITSLIVDWKFLQTNGVLSHNIVYNRENEIDEIDHVSIPKRDFLSVSIAEINVNHKIKATVQGYDLNVLKENQVKAEIPAFGIPKSGSTSELVTPLIENELDFLSFDSALLPISSMSVFLSPGIEKKIKLGHGSGFYELKTKHATIIDVQYDKLTNELVLKPKQIGETVIEIMDKCLKTEPSKLHISVVGIGQIQLSSPDRVERTKSIEGIARLYDTNDQLLDIDLENLNILQLSERVLNEHILSIKRGHQDNLQRGEIRYVLTGNELGETKIIVSSGSVTSLPAAVQVFPPLRLIPRNATILVGSQLEIRSRGGPKTDANIIYSVSNGEILSIEGSLVEGVKVGKTKVIGKSIATSSTGVVTTFTEDFVYVNVVSLNKIKIKAPLQRIKSETIMPLTIWADNDISPMVLGTLKSFKVKWQTDAPDIVELKDIFEDIGVIYSESDAISMRVRGLKQGKARITATAYHLNSRLQSSIDVVVFKNLELEAPKRIAHDPIIVPTKSVVQLKTNLDDTSFVIHDQADKSVINVSKDGSVKSFDMLGKSLIIASSASNDQRLDVPIEVKNINYIMASVVTNVQTKGVEKQLPKNLNFILTVSLHDNLGNKFSHSFEDIQWQLSNRDSVDVTSSENFTLSLKLSQYGSNMLAVSLRDATGIKHPEDFIKLSVKSSNDIFDNLIVTNGDIICFESPLNNAYNWISNSDSIVLHGSVGRIVSVPGSQKITVYHGLKDSTHMSYQLQVRNPDHIQFSKKLDIFNGESYNGHFVVSHHQQINKISNIVATNKSFCEDLRNESHSIDFVSCKLVCDDYVVLKKFEVKAIFDAKSLSYACEIQPLTSIEEITSYSRGRDIRILLEARLISSGTFDRIELRLTPAIQIHPRTLHIDKLHQSEITISGIESILQRVEVMSSHPDNLVLIPSSPKTVGRLQFKTRLHNVDAIDSELFIRVNSPLTQQTIQIPILPPSQDSVEEQGNNWLLLFLSSTGKVIASTILALSIIGVFFMCFRNRDLDTSGGEE